MSAAIGIDLGTTNTVAGAVRDGTATTLADEHGRRLIPSVVSFHPSGKVLVGNSAKDRRIIDATNTIMSVKRLIGRAWTTPEVQEAKKRFAFEMREGPKSGSAVVARGEQYTLPEISAFVLRHAKAVAEHALGEPVERAVITVPANFNDLQRAATKVAGKLAGLQVLRILNEPTAAALAYGQQEQAQSERIAVYDLGGGTFDVTILDLSGSVYEVLATAGDMQLGGDDLDTAIAERMAEQCMRQFRFDPRVDNIAIATLKMVAESVKRDLSTLMETTVEIPDIIPEGPKGTPVFKFHMTRAELEDIARPFIDRTFKTCQVALENAHLKVNAIHRTILVGGMTRMPMLVRKVEEFFKKPAYMKINPDEVVALGAAIQAGALDRSKKAPAKAKAAPSPGRDSETQLIAGRARPNAGAYDDLPVEGRPPAGRIHPDAPLDIGPARGQEAALFNALPVVGGPRAAPPPLAAPPPVQAKQAPPPIPAPAPFVLEFDENAIAESLQPEIPSSRREAPPPIPQVSNAHLQPTQRMPVVNPPAEKAPVSPPAFFDIPRQSAGLVFEPAALPPGRGGQPPPPRAPAASDPFANAWGGGDTLPRPEPPPAPIRQAVAAPLLIDVTPLSLSIETVGDFCDVLIARNTPVPCDKTRVFSTARDNQTSVSIRVSQGEQPKFSGNTYLGELELSGIAPAPRGDVQIAVTFELDADGILNIRAKEQATGRETRVKITLVGAQNDPGEIDAMMARQASKSLG